VRRATIFLAISAAFAVELAGFEVSPPPSNASWVNPEVGSELASWVALRSK
jgi:hypothetical protein